MIPDKVDMGDSPFARKFIVLSGNPPAARKTVTEALQSVLLEHAAQSLENPVCVILGAGGAVVLRSRTAQPEQLQDLIKLARRIDSTVQ